MSEAMTVLAAYAASRRPRSKRRILLTVPALFSICRYSVEKHRFPSIKFQVLISRITGHLEYCFTRPVSAVIRHESGKK